MIPSIFLPNMLVQFLDDFLDDMRENTHEPEALGLSKALSMLSAVAARYMLHYVLPQLYKLTKTLQTEYLDLSMIPSLVDATLNTLTLFFHRLSGC